MERLTPGMVAILMGCAVVAIVMLVPLRRIARSRMSFTTAFPWLAAGGYALVLWIYAVVPAPIPSTVVCRAPNLETFPNVVGAGSGGWLANPAIQELVLNTALFVPLGVMLALLFGRGVAVSTGVGLGASLAVELTQLTGSWGLYGCAYRQFSAEDVLLNTLGTAAGAALVWLARRRPWDGAYVDPETGRARSGGRRVLAIAIDVMTVALGCVAAVVFYRLTLITGLNLPRADVDAAADTAIGVTVAVVAQAVALIASGSTIGEQIVDLRRRARTAEAVPS